MSSDAAEVAALSAAVEDARASAAAGVARADASMRVANTARATANEAASKAADADAKAADLQALADTVQSASSASIADRANLHQQLGGLSAQFDALVGSVAGKASAESLSALAASVSTQASSLSALGGQVSALATSVAGKASQAALDTLSATVAGKASQAALDGLASSVSAVQTGLSSLAARVAVLESRQVIAVRRARVTLPAVAVLATSDITVTWSSPMPSATYSIRPEVEGAMGLGQLTAAVKSQTATGCVITVKAAVAIASGQMLDVVAIHV